MVIKDLYTYRVTGREENRIDATVLIDSHHPLYIGHFPASPITPGVCQLLIIKEVLEGELGMPLRLTKSRQIKFMAVHEPGSQPEIDATISFSITGDQLEVTARLDKNEDIFLKLKGEFRKQK